MEQIALEGNEGAIGALERITDPCFALDAQLRFVYANRAAQEFFSATTKDLLGTSVWDLGREGAMSLDFCDQLRKCMEDQSTVCFASASTLHADRRYEVRAYPSVEGVSILLRDISEREKEVAERTARLEDMVKSLEALCYNIAHDLRAPLRAMHGMSSALLEEYGAPLGEVGRDYAQRIVGAATRMDQLIQDLLAYGRLSRLELHCGNTDLEAPAAAAVARLREEIESRQAQVRIDSPMPLVWANPTLLEQILLNLVSNGLKFVDPSRTPRVLIRAERKEKAVRLWVEDNGIGIERDYHEKIFQIFERLYPENNEDPTGTGMGLAMVKKAAERLGGTVGVESGPGSGSRFWVDLPPAKPVSE